jgi:hypothetical protein
MSVAQTMIALPGQNFQSCLEAGLMMENGLIVDQISAWRSAECRQNVPPIPPHAVHTI